jgi:signal transduction histidine kinase
MNAAQGIPAANRRILVVDDNEAIHRDFAKILQPEEGTVHDVDADAALLFGAAPSMEKSQPFDVSFASQGQEALAAVNAARTDGRPFAMAFVDMRMPPGWDGLRTVMELWTADPEIQTVICTAYSDRTWEEIVAALKARDRWLVLKKPFDVIEVLQMANALTEKWNLARFAATKREAMERLVEIRTADLVREQKVVREFLMSASHELLTPLNGILGTLELLAGADPLPQAEQVQFVRDAERCAQDLHVLVRRILAFNQAESDRLECPDQRFQPLELLRECVQRHRSAASGKGIAIEARVADPIPADWIGPVEAIRNALDLLTDNAVKFTPQGQIQLEAGTVQGGLRFLVHDTGIGLTEAQLEWIRIPFAQADGSRTRRHSGIGIGLPLARRWAQAGGGNLEIDGSPDRGVSASFQVAARPCP